MPRAYVVFLGLFAALGSFLFGYDTGIITTSIAHASFKEYMGHPNNAMIGAIVSAYIGGEAVGAVLMSILGDKLGRKRFMFMMCVVVTVGTVIQTASQNYGMFLAGRVLTGIAVGGLVGTVPIFNSEISPPGSRGIVGGLSGLGIGLGTFLANWIGYLCGFAPFGEFQWRFPLSLQIPPGVILATGILCFLPESPRWLIQVGRYDEARKAFDQIRDDLADAQKIVEFDLMKEQILFEKSHGVSSLKEAWEKYRKRVVISIAVQTMTSLSGVNVINYYQTTLYGQLGIVGQSQLLLAAIYGTVSALANFVSLPLLDRVGRVPMLVWGCAALCIDLIYSALMSKYFATSDNEVGKGFAILGLYLYTTIYYVGINSTTWLYGVEVLPMSLRNRVMGLASMSHFVANIAITQAGPSAFANIKENYYFVFVGTTFVTAVSVYIWFPETKNKTLEEIAADFGDKVVTVEAALQDARRDLEARKALKDRPEEERIEQASS